MKIFGMNFARHTTLSLIDEQIKAGEKSLIENQGTAEHYAALAEGNRKTLHRLKLMREAETKDKIVIEPPSGTVTKARPPKPTLASAK
ncbi:MAG: hypothetical protein ACSLE8_06355 [Rhodococcus sp. (in: high G+C Gram-positive bacteria)]